MRQIAGRCATARSSSDHGPYGEGMPEQTSAVEISHPPEAVLRAINPLLGLALRSPLGAGLKDFMVVSFKGRKTGRPFSIPVSAHLVDGDLYVRAYNGHASRWYQAAMRQRGGRISVAGMTRDVSFEPAVDQLNERIDAAYRAKYRTSTYLNSMTGTRSRAATVKILPRA